MKSLIIASTSTLHGGDYLDYLLEDLEQLYQNTNEVIFIPYARPGGISHEAYTHKARNTFHKIGKTLKGIHEFTEPIEAIQNTKGIFTGGGNTFVLVNELYKNKLMKPLRDVLIKGTPYLGTSAGSNICGLTMHTTNDMPIVYPTSFKTLGIVPFNINPHYLDPDPKSTHMGETRATRIKEFHAYNSQPVIGLREGSWIKVKGNRLILKGDLSAKVFNKNTPTYEIETETDLGYLI